MIIETRKPASPTLLSTENPAMYDAYLEQRRTYKEELNREICAVCPAGPVLEVTSGWGYTGIDLIKAATGLRLHVLAQTEAVAGLAAANAEREGVADRVVITRGENEHMPFPDDYFAASFSTNAFHLWDNPQRIVCEMYRVLRPGGLLCINDLRRDVNEPIAEYIVREMLADTSPFGIYAFEKFMASWRASYAVAEIDNLFADLELADYDLAAEGAMTFTAKMTKREGGHHVFS